MHNCLLCVLYVPMYVDCTFHFLLKYLFQPEGAKQIATTTIATATATTTTIIAITITVTIIIIFITNIS